MTDPVEFFSTVAPAGVVLGVVLWGAAGIAAAIGIYFSLLSIKKGLGVFFAIVEERRWGAVAERASARSDDLVMGRYRDYMNSSGATDDDPQGFGSHVFDAALSNGRTPEEALLLADDAEGRVRRLYGLW